MKIINHKSRILYSLAREVLPEEFGESLDKMMSEMAILMYHSNGVGLAGPQVGSDLRILVADMGYVAGGAYGKELIKMVNPVLVSQSDFLVKAEEQCLSYPGLKVNVERANEITVKYLTPLGEERQDTYKDWQARVVLHEMEHLDGVNLYSRSSSLKKKRYDEMLKKKAK